MDMERASSNSTGFKGLVLCPQVGTERSLVAVKVRSSRSSPGEDKKASSVAPLLPMAKAQVVSHTSWPVQSFPPGSPVVSTKAYAHLTLSRSLSWAWSRPPSCLGQASRHGQPHILSRSWCHKKGTGVRQMSVVHHSIEYEILTLKRTEVLKTSKKTQMRQKFPHLLILCSLGMAASNPCNLQASE